MLPIARSLHDLHAELERFTSEPVLKGTLEDYEAICAVPPADSNVGLYNLIHHALMGADDVMEHYEPARVVPEHLLTINAVRAARNRKTPKLHDSHEDLCLSAELKVVNSIRLNLSGRGPHHGGTAAILFDVNGEAFAYHKSEGEPVALAWREAVIRTTRGTKVIPAGSFFRIGYGEKGKVGIQDKMDGLGRYLVSLEDADVPTDVRLYRFSAFLLDREIAKIAYENSSTPENYDFLRKYVPRTLNLGLDGVAEQTQTLLRRGHAYRPKSKALAA